MVFLTPLFLVGLLAALIPIGIHLIRREKPPKVMFSTIRFLKKTSKKLVLFQQLQQLLLLALRAGIIILLVIAFARPLINQAVSRLLDVQPQSAVVLLDNSMSMGYEDSFDLAKEEALSLLDGFNSGDEVALVVFSSGVDSLRELSTDIDEVRSLVSSMEQAGYDETQYLPNLRLADQILESSRFDNRHVYLISDFQAQAFAADADAWTLSPGVAFTGIDVGKEETTNLTLTDVRTPQQLLEDEETQQILTRVRSTGTVHLQQGEVRLIVNGEVADRKPIDLSEQSEQVVSLEAEFPLQGLNRGEIVVNGDSFSRDNRYFFTVDVLPKINVLMVNGESSENWYDDEGHWFSLAVSSTENSPFNLQTVEPVELTAAALRQNDVVVLLNVGELENNQARALSEYVENGGSLLIAPGDRVEADRFNQQFSALSPATLSSSQVLGRDDYLVIADFDRRHPILRPLGVDWSVRFQGHWAVQAHGDAQVLMRFDSAEPALLERQVGSGRVLLFASAMDLEWNNLPLQGLFLPFVHETLTHLVQLPSQQRAFTVGDTVALATAEQQLGEVSGAEGQSLDILRSNSSSADRAATVQASAPGFITAQVDGVEQVFSSNVATVESDFTRVPVASLYDRLVNPDTQPAQSRAVQTAQLIKELEGPQRIWWWILALVMVLFLLEGVVANRTYR